MFKINSILRDIKRKFSNSFHPYQNFCVDESLVLFKSRLAFKQHIPPKRSRYRIKVFFICDGLIGYVLDFTIYTGSTTEIIGTSELGTVGSIVMTLLEKYPDKVIFFTSIIDTQIQSYFRLCMNVQPALVATGKRNSNTGKEILKPLCIKEYNENRRIADKAAMQITFLESLQTVGSQ
jgi:hypothetical protein